MSALEFAEEHLFSPLGISGVDWTYGPGGNNMGWGDIRMTPHDMAKLGYLYLHEGSWDGEEVLPEIVQSVSGKRYALDANPFGLASLSLTFEEEDQALLSIAFMDGSQVDWPVGLDNVFRISPGRHGLPSVMKGSWESDDTFVIHLDEIGNINQFRIRSTFEDEGVTIEMQEMTGLGGATFGGKVEE